MQFTSEAHLSSFYLSAFVGNLGTHSSLLTFWSHSAAQAHCSGCVPRALFFFFFQDNNVVRVSMYR